MPPDAKEIRRRLLTIEDSYPDFKFFTSMNEVAMSYGWGHAVEAWSEYATLKELLEIVNV